MDFASLNLLILDVDGVLTDGRVGSAESDVGAARFHVQDGCAIKLWKSCGGGVGIISGRSGDAVRSRAEELGIDWIHTQVPAKEPALNSILDDAGCPDASVVYVGDDLPDIAVMARAGFAVAVADAVPAVKRAADYVTRREGGRGAVAEVIELVLRKQGRWPQAMRAHV